MSLRGALRELLPNAALRAIRSGRSGEIRFEGNYADWDKALQASGSYDNAAIVRKMCEAELAVKKGDAVDARDGVVFDRMQFSLPVVAALGRAARRLTRPLRVIDFGGAFGGSYRQYKAFYGDAISWAIVEQPDIVRLGEEHFRNRELEFHRSLSAAFSAAPADVALLSSVLQYLREPYALLADIARASAGHIVIDRTPCSRAERDVLTVQHVPPEIYAASYPCWIFSRQRLLSALSGQFTVLASFSDGSGIWRTEAAEFELAGFMLDRRAQARY
jgi:putative methyltransferase (TIGR04325 family)